MTRLIPYQRFLYLAGLGLTLVAGSVGSCNRPEGDPGQSADLATYFSPDWAKNALWDDGLAEVATYEAERVIYDKNRQFEYVLITVKEDFNKAYDVKTDSYDREDLFPVMKVNQFCRIPTDNYPYHFMTSLFFRRSNPVDLHKLTSSSQEWCGTTFKALSPVGNRLQFSYNSYWDGQGTGKMTLDKGLLFEDQLPYSLRSLKFKEGLAFSWPLAGLMQTSKASAPDIYPAAFAVKKVGADWQVDVQLGPGKRNTYWFAGPYPHVLLRQQTWDGRSLRLKEVKRYAYWKH
ncbi:MAG: hypothetical protein ACO1NZ_17355 [Adhaeribacter sp.]